MSWIIWTGVAAGLGTVLMLAQMARQYGSPGGTASEVLAALSAADTARLRKDEMLGLTVRAESEVSTRGTAEYNRIIAIFHKASRLGSARYDKARRQMWDAGEAAFEALPYDQQSAIRKKSKYAWLSREAFASLTVDERNLFGAADVLSDKSKMKALAYAVGKPKLSEEDRTLIGEKDPDAEAVQQDKALAKIVGKARRGGLATLTKLAKKANRAARAKFRRLNWRARRTIKKASYVDYVWKEGFKGHADRSYFKKVSVLKDPPPGAVAAIKRAMGLNSLPASERAEIKDRNYDAFVAARVSFIETAGTRLYKAFLKGTFLKDCCGVARVRYVGRSSRSLLRNRSAVVVLSFGPEPAGDVEVEHPAKDYLGQAVLMDYVEGKWKIGGFGKDPSGKLSHGVSASIQVLKSPGTIVSLVLLLMLGLAVVLAVALRRSSSAIAVAEGAAAVLLLAVVQVLVQGQISTDDVFFTPIYMAIPVWLGIKRGAEPGFMAGFVTGLGITAASALVTVAPWAAVGSNELLMQEHFLATLFLAVTGAAAGRLRWPVQLPMVLPVLWMLFYVGLDRGLMLSFNFYGHVVFGCAVAGLGMVLLELGLLDIARRVFEGKPE